MEKKTPEQVFQDFLLELDTNIARQMLADLQDPEKCTPMFYNAVGKLLERHKFHISRFNPEQESLKGLGNALSDYDNVVAMGDYN